MDTNRRSAVLGLALLLILLVASATPSVAAQTEVVFSSLDIDLWPDYDRPGVLVIYRGTIAPGVSLPARLTLRIPAAAGDPSAVAERQTDGQLIVLPYERRVEGEVAVLEMTATRPIVQIEYYDPAISRDGVVRSFEFTWPGDYQVGALSVSVQQPDLAQNLVTEPAAASRAPSVDGLMYHTVALGAVAAGESVALQVSYEKASDQLSVETMTPVQQEPPPSVPPSAPGADSEMLLIVMVILAIGAIVTIAVVVLRRRDAPGAGAAASGAAPTAMPRGAVGKFCTQCGTGAGAGDRFCHSCGAALR